MEVRCWDGDESSGRGACPDPGQRQQRLLEALSSGALALHDWRSRERLLLEIARRAGHLPLGTFDRDLGKLEGAETL